MRTMAGVTIVIAGALAVCITNPASAARKPPRGPAAQQCSGLYSALENGKCVHTQWINPDRLPGVLYCGPVSLCYRAAGKHRRHRPTNG
jgi:hypothetical protein